jgi:glycosyltransferase involved in cell wall biosynthesis
VRVAVYDAYWSTLGGGEQFAGGIAAALARQGNAVDLVGPDPVDPGRFAERLGIDMGGLGYRPIGQESDVTSASAEYDLLVNCTYQSVADNRAAHGLYVVHFPGRWRRTDRWKDQGRRLLGRRLPADVVLRRGFYQPDGDRPGRRTDGASLVDVYAPPGTPVGFRLRAERAGTVSVWDGRRRLAETDAAVGAVVELAAATDGEWPAQFTVESATVDHEARAGVVWRYGATLDSVAVDGRWRSAPPDRLRAKLLPPRRLGHLATYDRVVANSAFTARWVERLWGRHTEVLYPPVRLLGHEPRAKERLILTVGRFFDPQRGHSKKQLELVRVFRRLHDAGALSGWSLHLVGGCSPDDRSYAMAVRREALGLPVHVHVNAPGATVHDLYRRAALYWHAGGYGEDPERHPDRFEHFGISVVEAMSAGAVPVVFGAAGPAEVVRDGIDGRHWHAAGELATATVALADDDTLRARLAASGVTRAESFGPDAFARRLEALVDPLARRS